MGWLVVLVDVSFPHPNLSFLLTQIHSLFINLQVKNGFKKRLADCLDWLVGCTRDTQRGHSLPPPTSTTPTASCLLLQLRAAFAAVMLFSVDSVKKGMMPLVVTSAGIE